MLPNHPDPGLPDPNLNLGAHVRALRRAAFAQSLAAGSARQFVLPLSITGTYLVPILYLSIPHERRPWLRRARLLVFAFVVCFNVTTMMTTSSGNPAGAYASGLVCAWGIVWAARMLIWENMQRTAARVQRRRKGEGEKVKFGDINGGPGNGSAGKVVKANGHSHANGAGNGHEKLVATKKSEEGQKAPDESVAAFLDEYEYYWQPFPANGPLLTRLLWATDLIISFRGSGWSWTPCCYPRFQTPVDLRQTDRIAPSLIPVSTKHGFSRNTTYSSFLLSRLQTIALGYILLDLCGVLMMKDPYFVLGPEFHSKFNHTLPPYLSDLPQFLLEIYRSALSFVGVVAAISMYFNVDHLLHVYLFSGPASDMWQHPTIFGSFDAILERGLAGFWGSWWHQTFRAGFEAPTAWLVRNGYLPSPTERDGYWTRLFGGLLAFLQSGFLHAAGSFTTVPETRPWEPFLFFVLQYVGIFAQEAGGAGLRVLFGPDVKILRPWRRLGNIVFVVLWLHFTRWALINDFARCGLWLFEPVPFSLFRGFGLGKSGETIWRWGHQLPGWYVGKHWWESGIHI